MLPFLKKKQDPGVSTTLVMPAPGKESKDDNGLESAAQDILNAIQNSDIKGLAQALQAAFDIMESSPHDEAGEPQEQPEENE
jgi:phosphoribosyl-dephospho-CoA transferase